MSKRVDNKSKIQANMDAFGDEVRIIYDLPTNRQGGILPAGIDYYNINAGRDIFYRRNIRLADLRTIGNLIDGEAFRSLIQQLGNAGDTTEIEVTYRVRAIRR